jgi:hypothetical protein
MNQTPTVVAVVAVVLAAAVVAGATPAAAATQQEDASLGDSYVEVVRGETTSITVSHSASANLTIGGDEDGFEVVVPLGGSGSDTVEFDTYQSTSANPDDFLSVNGATLESAPIEDAVEPGRYSLTVTIDGVTEAVGTLEVLPRGETTIEPGAVPGSVDLDEASAGDVLSRLTKRETVAVGDYAAFVVEEEGLENAIGDSPTPSTLTAEGFGLSVTELDPEPNTDAEQYGGASLHVISRVPEDDRLLVLWDTSGLDLGDRSNHTYEYELWLDDSNPLAAERETLVRERVTLETPRLQLDADPGFELDAWDGDRMRVNGTTNLAPTTALDVRALQDTPTDYLWKHVVSVSGDGTFSVTFDFAPAERPGSFPLWVLGHEDETRHVVRLRAANGSLLFPSQSVQDDTVTLENVTLSEGGFLRLTANSSTVGVTDALQSVTNASVTVPLDEPLDGPTNVTATAIVDADGDGEVGASDPVYGSWNTPVRDTAVIQPAPVEQDNTTTATTTTPNRTTTNTTTATATKTTIRVNEAEPLAPAASNDPGSSGGFVPLSPVTTLVALCAAALLALRRGPDRL